jgi:uncharacterized protein with FMN-binding domain
VRTSTRNAVTVVGLGVLGVSYSIGAAAQTGNTFNSTTIGINGTDATAAAQAAAGTGTSGSTTTGTTDAGTGTTTSGTSSSGSGKTTTGSSSSGTSSTSGSTKTTTKTTTGSTSSGTTSGSSSSGSTTTTAPAPAATTAAPAPAATSAAPKPAAVTKTSATINYRFGVVQVSVTKDNGKITAVNLVQGTATHGRESTFPYLQQYALSAQGSGFANMSGATYTTDAFKQAVDSALSKF